MNHRVVANGVPLDARHATLPKALRHAGFDPNLIGYTTTVPDPRTTTPADVRFTEWGEAMEGWRVVAHFDEKEWRNYFAWARDKGVTLPDKPISLMAPDGPPGPTALPARIPAEASDTAWTTEHALRFLRTTRPGRPWVLHCGYFRPHPPFAAPAPWHQAVALDRVPAAMCGKRTADGKDVHFAALPPVLYDLRRDPHETRNVAADPAYAGLLSEAAGRMLSWRMAHADRTLTHLCTTESGLVDWRAL